MKNRYPLGFRDWIKYRVIGNRLARKHSASQAIRTVSLFLAMLACYAVAGSMDYQIELKTEADTQADRAEAAEQILLDCLNGKAQWLHDNHSGKGYQKTVISCKGTEEFKV